MTDWHLRPIALPLLAGALSMAAVALLARRARAPGRVPLILLALAFAVYDVGYALEVGATRVEDVRLFLRLEYLGVPFIPVLVLLAAVVHVNARRLVTPWSVAIASLIPLGTCLLAWTNESHELIWRNLRIEQTASFTRTFFERGAWYWVHTLYSYLLLGGAVLVIAVELSRARGLFRRQLQLVLTAILISVATHVVYLMTPVFAGLDPNPYAQSLTALVLAWGMLDARLWDVVPVARETVLSALRDAVIVIDARGRLAEINGPASALLGERAPGDALGDVAAEAFPALAGPLARARTGELVQTELSLPVSGVERHFDATFTPLFLAPASVGTVLVLHDITERVELARLRESLTRTMVHDLRNPLTSIQGVLELFDTRREQLDAAMRELLDLGLHGTQRMVSVVNAILDVERLKGGKLALERHPADLAALLRQTLRAQRPLAAAREQQLEGELPDAVPAAEVDAVLIDRVIQNLVGNALKFTPRGGVIQVWLRHDPDGEELEIGIRDDGPGIPPQIRDRLFGEFVAGHAAGSGSGLGLAFCRLAVEAHGGSIGLDPAVEQGACFRIRLPLGRAAVAARPP